MSTEESSSRVYRRRLAITVVVLVTLVLVLAAVGALRSPRVSVAQLDVEDALVNAGSRLSVLADQPLKRTTPRVTITPRTVASVVWEENALVVTIRAQLRPSTEYRVVLGNLVSAVTGRDVELQHTFRTPGQVMHTLVRSGSIGDGRPDRVERFRVGDEDGRTVFSADSINQIAELEQAIAVVALARDGGAQVRLVATRQGDDTQTVLQQLTEPPTALRASASANAVGYVTAPRLGGGGERLYVHDLSRLEDPPRRIVDPQGEPLQVVDWAFVPKANALVAQDVEGRLYLIDLASYASTPLGNHDRLNGFVPGTSTLTVVDSEQTEYTTIDLSGGREKPAPITLNQEDEPLAQVAEVVLLNAEREWLLRLETDDGRGIGTSSRVDLRRSGRDRTLVDISPEEGIADQLCPSPDAQLFALTVHPSDGKDDGYPAADVIASKTIVVDVSSRRMWSFEGSNSSWCSS